MVHVPRPLVIVGFAAAVVPVFCCTGFGLWFAPGWANGWPIHRNVVWPAGLACFAFVTTLLLVAVVWATFRAPEEPPPTWPPSRVWVLGGGVVSAVVASMMFIVFHIQALAIWP